MLEYQIAVWRHAIARSKMRLRESRTIAIRFFVQAAVLLAVLYFLPILGNVQSEARMVLATMAAALLSALLIFIGDLLVSPSEIWHQNSRKIADLTAMITPAFTLSPLNAGKPQSLSYGTIQTSWSGQQTAYILSHHLVLGLICSNTASVTLRGCEAYLTRLKTPRAPHADLEPVRLSWVPIDQETTVTDIPPSGGRNLILFQTREGYLHFNSTTLPVEAVQVLLNEKEAEGTICVTSLGGGPQIADFKITSTAEGPLLTLVSES